MKRTIRRALALAALVALVAVPTTLPVLAQSGGSSTPTRVQHRQSVLTQVDPTGLYESSIVVTQLLVSGSGTAEVVLEDQATEGLRNLEGFDRPTVSGSSVAWRIPTSPEGTLRRTVADADPAALPIAMTITYELDGEEVTPSQLVGKNGFLTVTYTLTNLTAEQREVRYFDGQGRPRTATVEVAVPMGGTFSATLDPRFVNVEAPDATAIAGDGSGNTVVNGAFTLFEPAGTSTQSFSWSAFVTDAIVPAAEITILPVSSRTSPSVGSGQAQLEQLIDGFKNITNGGLILNSNLLRLSDGAGELADGLANSAAPGARELADGLAKTAAPGAKTLADGLATAAAGSEQLAGGAYLVADGISEVRAEVYGAADNTCSAIAILTYAGQIGAAFQNDPTDVPEFAAEVAATLPVVLSEQADELIGTWATEFFTPSVFYGAVPTDPVWVNTKSALLNPATPGNTFYPTVLTTVVSQLAVKAAASEYFPTCNSVVETLALLNTMVNGSVPQLSSLENLLADNVTAGIIDKLSDKKGDVNDLASGAYAVADGTTTLAKGLIDTAAPGAKRLADGLKAAADGAGALADGLGDAADGATTIAGGTVALSEALEGQLVGGTTEGAADLSLRLAQLNAADARGIAYEGYPFGVAAGSDATAVYAFEIAGVGGEGGPSSSGLALAALGALALAALLGLALRRKAA